MTKSETRLRDIVERVERLMEERHDINADIRDVLAEGKALGFDVSAIKKVIQRRKMTPDDRAEMDALIEVYEDALGGARPEPVAERPAPASAPKKSKSAAATLAWLETGKGN
jgi:uncharacterized protein (UPF0335 family)